MSSEARGSAPALTPTLLTFMGVRVLVLATLAAVAWERGLSAYRVLVKWDAQWYGGIAASGYGFTRLHQGRLLSDYAFFPLFPVAERAVAAVSGLSYVDAGLAVSAASSLLAAAGIFAVAERVGGRRVAFVATVLWALLPIGVVESMSYSESLFTALAAWALYAVLTERWVAAGVFACLAGLTRPVGVAAVAAVVVAAVAHVLEHRRARMPLVGALVAPLGVLGYLAWVAVQVGSPGGYFEVASGWGNGFDGGVAFAGWIWHLLTGPTPLAGVGVLAGLAVLAALLWLSFAQRQPLPLLVFSVVLVFLAVATSGYFGSKPRYLLPAFPLLLPAAQWLARRAPWLTSTLLTGLAVLAAAYGAIWLLGPGPP